MRERTTRKAPKSTPQTVPALEAAFREGGVHLIAASIDYNENIRVLVDELRSAALDSQAERLSLLPRKRPSATAPQHVVMGH
jgi:hypothetical protein